jgi:pantoate--beta-alanine ligase
MIVFKKKEDVQHYVTQLKKDSKRVAFVPTMGALHPGHISLITTAKTTADIVISSIFVNPTQFNNASDLEKYPRTTTEDVALLTAADCDVLFLPEVTEIYPPHYQKQTYNIGYLDHILEGSHRPGHFQGVAEVVDILLQIVQPNVLLLGQKDYQQCAVLSQLVAQKQYDITVQKVPTLREADGLAMSSRNRRLTEAQRSIASLIYQCLVSIQAKQGITSFSIVQKECWDILKAKGFEPEYISLADADTLVLLNDYDPNKKMVALIAASIGAIRLIDNLSI